MTFKDAALVAAAVLSHRYITDRFLPDKAIDLVDEAASRLRMEIDSMPVELDEVRRRVMQLEIEREALRKETDKASLERLAKLDQEIANLKEDQTALQARWQREKDAIKGTSELKQQLEDARRTLEDAERVGDYAKASELKYADHPGAGEAHQRAGSPRGRRPASPAEGRGGRGRHRRGRRASGPGIPVSRLMEGEIQKLLKMEERLHQRVVGQDEAINAVANAIRRARAGLQDPNRPLGSFIFLGPTGVGKTELARALAEFLFDDEHSMIRIDMSEYQEKHTVSRLVGAPPGYIGYDEAGQLTEAVRRRPYAVVLFDEVEKAHPDVLNLLLQLLDEGHLTDSKGRRVDFKNTVVIMTSNLPSLEALRGHFRPEFINRIDEIVFFHKLSKEQTATIVDIQLGGLLRRLADRKITVELTAAAKDLVVQEGYDPVYGARPLKRALQRMVLDPLALRVLDGEFGEGDHIVVDAGADRLGFSKRQTIEAGS